MPRADRRIKKIAGIGGRMEVRYPLGGVSAELWTTGILDVARWEVRHKALLTTVTHSGSNGAIKRAIVARDFSFASACPWNSRDHVEDTPEGDVLFGFIEQILTGHVSEDYNVSVRFFLGDPLSYRTDAGLPQSSKRCLLYAPLVLAENFNTVCDSTGTDVVRVNFTGQGNSLLEAYRGIDPVFGGVIETEQAPA